MSEDTPSKQAGRTKDARGRSVALLDPYALHLLCRHDVIPAEALASIAADLGSGLTKIARLFFVLGVVCTVIGAVALVVVIVRMVQAGGMVWNLPKPLLLANLWVVPFALWMGACQIRSRRTWSVMLKHLRCPHCGYDIRGLPADPLDGATVCPECGCAWMLVEAAESICDE